MSDPLSRSKEPLFLGDPPLDAAWAEAEAAAEAKGWRLEGVQRAAYQPKFQGGNQTLTVVYWEAEARGPWEGRETGGADTPTGALRALEARLRQR